MRFSRASYQQRQLLLLQSTLIRSSLSVVASTNSNAAWLRDCDYEPTTCALTLWKESSAGGVILRVMGQNHRFGGTFWRKDSLTLRKRPRPWAWLSGSMWLGLPSGTGDRGLASVGARH